MTGVSTHVLDAARGRPAAGLTVRLDGPGGELAVRQTDDDGRVSPLLADLPGPGDYRLTFATAAYWHSTGQTGFYPEVVVTFTVTDPAGHHHVPLLLAPYSYSTYRGS